MAANATRSLATHRLTQPQWMPYVLWVGAAAAIGFGVSAICSGLLELPRNWYLLAYVGVMVPFLSGYFRWSGIDIPAALRHHWLWGLIGGVFIGTWVVMRMLEEPASPRPEGLALIGALVWLGLIYGVVDALLLTVLPVSAIWLAFKSVGATDSWRGKLAMAVVALVASYAVTAAYHLGYVEYRGSDLVEPVIGNGLMSLSFLVTGNPITAVVAHVAMHVASVLHGIDTTVTLPPHY